MTPNALAGMVLLALAIGCSLAIWLTRKMMRRPAVASTGVLMLLLWTILVGGIPYAIFAIGASGARERGTLSGIGAVVIGLLPLTFIAAPLIAGVYALKHFSNHIKQHFAVENDLTTIDEPSEAESRGYQQRARDGIRNRDEGTPRAETDLDPDQGEP